MLSQEELRRLHVIQRVNEKRIKQREAARILGLSTRQVRRVIKRVRKEGDRGIVHKSRGKPSNRRMPAEIRNRVIELYRSEYADFGPTLAAEKLLERNNLEMSDETLRLWLIESGDWTVKQRKRQHRQWRERKHHRGEMVQIDGSHHDWFEGRGPKCVLMGYIDDATGKVYARFYEYEGTFPAMDGMKRYIRNYGIPVRIYLDKHTTYKSPGKALSWYGLYGEESLSQFQRAMKELAIEVIHANSPQAKGRIERLFKTFQDRVVKEMRLRKITNIQEGNRFLQYYLPIYNRRFAVQAKEKANLHRKLPAGLKLDTILCKKTERTLRNDFTVSHNGRLYQITESTEAGKVTVEEKISGSLHITYNENRLTFREIRERPEKQQKKKLSLRRKPSNIPSANHPWRIYKLKSQLKKTGS